MFSGFETLFRKIFVCLGWSQISKLVFGKCFSELEFSLFEKSRIIVVVCPCGQRFVYHALQIVLGPAGGKKSVKL